ncbi:putative transposase-associated domain-containing protein [Tanacetum coccineum]
METNRISKSYVGGVAAFTDYAHKVEEVQYHLYRHGIDISYTKWTKHGDEDEPSISAPKPINATTEFVDDIDFAYILTDGPATVEMVNPTKVNFDVDDLVKFQELLLDAEKPLYEGCHDFTKLSAIVKLLNLKGKYGASDKFFTELLGLIKKMLPAGNEMVEKTYQAKKVMRLMGSGYKKIHVCINNCLLYWKNDKDLTACQTCGTSKWNVDNKTKKVYKNIPAKVMWYFPIIPRLQRLFKIESILEDLRWHATRRITDGVLRHPADSQAWRTIDEKFLEIAEDTRNLRLGISADGVDVNTGNRHHRYPGNDINIFLEPLLDDLHTLFETRVDTYDASTKDNFNLRAVVLWTINDYPAFGTLCGCLYSGFKGCVVATHSSDSYSTSQISTSEEIDYDSPEPPKSLLKWYHYLSDEYKDNGRFWGSKSGCNESDVKPSWKDIEKAKACMLAKAQASEASSKAKVEACGSKAKLQASTKTLIVKSPGRGSLEVDKIIDISSDSSDDRRWAAKKASAPVFYGPSTQGLLDAYGYNTIEEYLSWNYFPSTDNESTNMETTDKGNTDKDCIDDSNSAMSKGKYVPVCKKNNPNVYSHVPVTGCVLGLASVTTWDEIEKKMGARKTKTCADKAKGKRKVSCGS